MTLDEVFDSILAVGRRTGTDVVASDLVERCRARLDTAAALVATARRPATLVLEWTDPAFTAGHWVPDLVTAAGGECLLGRRGQRSEGVDWSTISSSDAEMVIVAPCGYRLDGAALLAEDVVRRSVLPAGAEVWAVDADAVVVRPGPRVVDGVELFASILHPDLVGDPDPAAATRVV